MTLMLSNHPTQEMGLGSKPLAIRIRFALALQEQLPTMLQLGSTGYDSSLTWTSRVYVTTIRSSQGDIYCISAEDFKWVLEPQKRYIEAFHYVSDF